MIQSSREIDAIFRSELVPALSSMISQDTSFKIFFYGAGCSSAERNRIVSEQLQACFPNSEIEVDHDLMAAARALCGREEGIATILGTGSNSCYYNGQEIVANTVSLGFILGDEGSGAYMGKKLLAHYFYGELPDDLAKKFQETYHLDKDSLLEAVYKKPNANRYLASFSKFMQANIQHPFIARLIYQSFSDFIDRQVSKYFNYLHITMHSTGSVGFYFSGILKQVAADKGITIGRIIKNPISALTLYHLGE